MKYLNDLKRTLKIAQLNIEVAQADRNLAYAKLHAARVTQDIDDVENNRTSDVIFDPETLVK